MKKKRKRGHKGKKVKKERAVIIIKPDAIKKKLISRILFRFEKNGLRIVALKMTKLKKRAIERVYFHLKAKLNSKLFNAICNWMCSEPVIVGAIEGANVIKKAKKIVGPTNPVEAYRGTIRGDFSRDDMIKRARMNLPVRNIIHVSSTKTEARKELMLFRNLLKIK